MRDYTGVGTSIEAGKRWAKRFLQARFFLAALLFHVGVFLIFATKVVIDAVQSRDATFTPDTFVIGTPPSKAPDTTARMPIRERKFDGGPAATVQPSGPKPGDLAKDVIRGTPTGMGFSVPIFGAPAGGLDSARGIARAPEIGKFNEKQLRDIGLRRQQWFLNDERGYGKVVAKFTVHIGQPAQGGDTLAFVRFGDDGREIIGGSVPNLAEMLNRFSKGRIKARVQSEVLRLDSPEIYRTNPPFIYLTGRSDFRLTEEEILNIRKYLVLGGCIWGDNALPGYRSRFDVAFRREMKRIIPDDDKPFERLPETHPIYGNSGFKLGGAPAGLNFAKFPVEAIKIDGIEAVIYTANGYGAMWQVTFDDSLQQVDNAVMQRTEKEFWEYRKVFYRNLNEDTLLKSYRLGYNIVLHLLLRYEAKVRGLPQT